MKNYDIYKCKIERSKINGNYTIWLPEQEDNDFVSLLVDKNDLTHGRLWELLLKVSAKDMGLDLIKVYFEPEGDVFVAYTKEYELGIKMEAILNQLISNLDYLIDIVNLSGLKKK
ncbi:hypothetical protein ACOKFD_06005 [Flagellimonas sp. S174]|uniref:hypothetical protein n=1 Tax=Flagellimonas sp. S174 TaxID=3410790 RepID=UPI003BF58C97